MNNKLKVFCIFLITVLLSAGSISTWAQFSSKDDSGLRSNDRYEIVEKGDTIVLRAGCLERILEVNGTNISSKNLLINGENVFDRPSSEISISFYAASPDAEPAGIKPGDEKGSVEEAGMSHLTDILKSGKENGFIQQSTQWLLLKHLKSSEWAENFDLISRVISKPEPGVTRLTIRVRSTKNTLLQDVFVTVFYEVYEGFPAIRKWVEITNNGPHWLKVDSLTIDGIVVNNTLQVQTDLTPTAGGAGASLRSFSTFDKTRGLIIGSEIPSALRFIDHNGSTGYTPAFFEWVLGPVERFTSEPVFMYGYSARVWKTISGVSTPLDRTVEGPFQVFLKKVIGILSPLSNHLPLWCTWSNFGPDINSGNLKEMADLAEKAGFKGLQLDAGWAKNNKWGNWASNSRPDSAKFEDFSSMARYIRGKGLQLGLWISDFRDPDIAPDFKAVPDGAMLPHVYREGGLAMSFTSRWKHYFANDILYLNDVYGATYFKQDLTAIKYGDIAASHESRTQKESLLRGLRGLLEVESYLIKNAPNLVNQLTHEIYWGTPGVPCDIAALKISRAFHIPPNDYSGAGHPKKRFDQVSHYNPDSLRRKLIEGCFNARQRLYEYRGLPLYPIEYYAAATFNFKGSLTKKVQQRQVCSWLMGALNIFAGDLASLTDNNLSVYKTCFDMVDDLNKKYNMFNYFQFSGVPSPTDTGWHWWGKLNEKGLGAVIVLRGAKGSSTCLINVPWVLPNKRYKVTAKFSGKNMGIYTGQQLIDGKMKISLDTYGQEILELSNP